MGLVGDCSGSSAGWMARWTGRTGRTRGSDHRPGCPGGRAHFGLDPRLVQAVVRAEGDIVRPCSVATPR
jgi:hypothetical protein